MRGAVAELPSPHPVVATLPGIYQGQPFLERFCGSLDDVLAPVVSTLDNLPAYLDVGTAPPDFLPWLAYWMGMPLGPGQSSAARRQVLRAASTQQGWQGTARGIVLVVEAVFGCRAEVEDSGGTTWSRTPEDLAAAPSAWQPPSVVVRVDVPDGRVVDERRLDALVAALKPAHVAHRVEVRDGR
jgi:phage tail-like protein